MVHRLNPLEWKVGKIEAKIGVALATPKETENLQARHLRSAPVRSTKSDASVAYSPESLEH